jgi:hypothetical protein
MVCSLPGQSNGLLTLVEHHAKEKEEIDRSPLLVSTKAMFMHPADFKALSSKGTNKKTHAECRYLPRPFLFAPERDFKLPPFLQTEENNFPFLREIESTMLKMRKAVSRYTVSSS